MKEICQNDSLGLNPKKQRCKITEAFLAADLQDCTVIIKQKALLIDKILFLFLLCCLITYLLPNYSGVVWNAMVKIFFIRKNYKAY